MSNDCRNDQNACVNLIQQIWFDSGPEKVPLRFTNVKCRYVFSLRSLLVIIIFGKTTYKSVQEDGNRKVVGDPNVRNE